jgi:elongation of very long chain fatty acids protein 6
MGDILFSAFLAGFAAMMVASFQKRIPYQSWEIMSLAQHLSWAEWMIELWWLPVVLSVAYLVLTFGTQAFLKNRKGWDKELRMPLVVWSLLLAGFSVAGALRTVPMVIEIVSQRGVMHMVCGDTRHEWLINTPAGFWTLWFCLSKIPELIDTAFIVLRKKQLITLHWYHHFTVMLFCWQAWASCTLNGLIFAAMNLTVHSIMYTFYALTAFGWRPSTFAMFITLGQISQMVVGTAVTAYVTLDKVLWHPINFKELDLTLRIPPWFNMKNPQPDGGECFVSSGNALAGLIMYGSYLLFFVHFFVKAYCLPGGKGE